VEKVVITTRMAMAVPLVAGVAGVVLAKKVQMAAQEKALSL